MQCRSSSAGGNKSSPPQFSPREQWPRTTTPRLGATKRAISSKATPPAPRPIGGARVRVKGTTLCDAQTKQIGSRRWRSSPPAPPRRKDRAGAAGHRSIDDRAADRRPVKALDRLQPVIKGSHLHSTDSAGR
uniref:Uncharacterized protein n=1 Tax=Plectus sambesii TaxID=2011161 RepID=A0A914VHQ0_9BILA